jgi:SAM-dependent methyltransferase
VALGCTPNHWPGLGLSVTGVDISRTSLAYARRRVRERGLRITYRYQDYLALRDRSRYDVALLIYFDFGVLADAERDELLARIYRSLRRGGVLVFDVWKPGWQTDAEPGAAWSIHESGFWRRNPYLQQTRHFAYAQADVHLRQTLIVDTDRRITAYRFSDRAYSQKTITRVLEHSGFRVEELWADFAGTPFRPDLPAFCSLPIDQPQPWKMRGHVNLLVRGSLYEPDPSTDLEEISENECLELLERHQMGPIALVVDSTSPVDDVSWTTRGASPHPLAPGVRIHRLAIRPTQITGRRFTVSG